jgi:drug/metabolite transporter (DMT)-like permease
LAATARQRFSFFMTDRKSRLDTVAVVSLVACCALWGLNQVAAKLALAGVPPLTQAALRSLGAAALVLGWAAWRGIALTRRDGSLRGGLLAGALFAAEFGCIFVGLQFTSASRMVVFIYLAPFVVALGMPFIARSERLSGAQMAGLGMAFAGVAYALAEGFTRPSVGPLQWAGDALGVAAALLWGGTTLTIRASRLASASAEKTLLYQLGLSGVLLALAAPLAGEAWPRVWPAWIVALLAFQTVIVTFASYLLWFWLIRHYPATRLAAFTLLTPVFGLLAGAGLLAEPVTARLVVALAAVTLGIAIVNTPARLGRPLRDAAQPRHP